MAYRVEKNGKQNEVVISGFDKGIQASPHLGIADMKNVNINSLTGEAAVNYGRVNTLPVVSSGSVSGTASAPSIAYQYGTKAKLAVGSCIVPSSSTITNFTANKPYWVTAIVGDNGTFQFLNISASYGGSNVTPGTTGSATINTFSLHKFIQGATEYDEGNNVYIYYLCDSSGVVWVNDPNVYGVFAPAGNADGTSVVANVTGFGITQGVAYVFTTSQIYANQTKTIGVYTYSSATNQGWRSVEYINTPTGNTSASHYALQVPDQNGSLYYCDSQWLGQISSIAADTAGTQRYSFMDVSCDGSTATLTISKYNQGTVPGDGLPVALVAKVGASLPTGLTASTQYYIKTGTYNQSAGTFQIATSAGGSAVTPSSVGSFYVTSFIPDPTFTKIVSYTKQALALPYADYSNCLGYFSTGGGIAILVGTTSNNVYVWSPGTSAPSSILPLPEPNTHRILNVDNTMYIFAGNKGNIYISNGTVLAGALSIPDYIANPNGGNQDPYFIWGDSMFLRGRVWFSIQDQHAGNTTGNCGGVWSFTPTQNLFLGQDQGVGLHLENENSYNSYNGVCDVLLPSQNQQFNGPQYWSGWSDSYTSANYGIDFSDTSPYHGSVYTQIDTDIIPIGTYLTKHTPTNIEYKLSRPLVSGESVQVLYRPDLTSAFTSLGTDTTAGNVGFKFPDKATGIQWIQLRAKMTSTASSPSFVPLTELRIRL